MYCRKPNFRQKLQEVRKKILRKINYCCSGGYAIYEVGSGRLNIGEKGYALHWFFC
jgi:hypothetical protein